MKYIEIDINKRITFEFWWTMRNKIWKPSFRYEKGQGHLNIPFLIFITWF